MGNVVGKALESILQRVPHIKDKEDIIREKLDYSKTCNKNDEDQNNPCWSCNYFLFPIGCMFYEDK